MDGKPSKSRLILLVLRAQAGDGEAVDWLLETHQNELFGYLVKMLGDHTDAEEALQTTLVQAVRKLKWLREPAYFRSWIYRIASRNAFRVIKLRKRRKELSNTEFVDAASQSDANESDQEELIKRIPDWLDQLTPNGREVLILHYLDGFTTEEVAEILNIPLGTAKSRISYALACIRKQINSVKD